MDLVRVRLRSSRKVLASYAAAGLTGPFQVRPALARHETGGLIVMGGATPTALVAELAARHGGEVPGLTVTRPTLEDVYLKMIGHS